MYLARFEIGSEPWIQGAVHLPGAYDAADPAWREQLRSILAHFEGAPSVRTSYRLAVTPQSLQRIVFASTAEKDLPRLRSLLGRFGRLAALDDDSVEFMESREAYDALIGTFGAYCCPIPHPDYRIDRSGTWVAADFRVWPALDALCTEAAGLGYSFAYHANFEPIAPDRAWLRSVARNVLAIEGIAAAPVRLVESQQRIADRAAGATQLIEELVGTDSPETADWLGVRLQRLFREQFAGQRLDPPSFEFDDSPHDCALVAMRHRTVFEELTPAERLSLAIPSDEWQALLGFTPPERFAAFPRIPAEDDGVAEPTRAPAPYLGAGDYFFVSYKRHDMPRIAPILEHIVAAGHRIWYDSGIPGGSEWDAEIEARLERCSAVVLFATQAAIDSKYVRREVKFADALGKPLLTVKVEEADLTRGMSMLLTQYQMIDVSARDFRSELERALRYIVRR